jgi:hypothetical protein
MVGLEHVLLRPIWSNEGLAQYNRTVLFVILPKGNIDLITVHR